MLIDWFTVSAQAVNFLILVGLLKRFLYRPVLRAIDEREKRIASQLLDADARKAEAQRERDDFQNRNQELAQHRDALMSKAAIEAQAESRRLTDAARQQADALRNRLQEALRSERDNLRHEITRRTRQEVFSLARKALSDLASATLEERMTEVFIRRLRELDGAETGRLTSFLKEFHRPAIVRSAFELPPAQRQAIQDAVRESLGAEAQLQFETSPALVSGIELTTNGHKVAWSLTDYLVSLERNVDELLEAQHAPPP